MSTSPASGCCVSVATCSINTVSSHRAFGTGVVFRTASPIEYLLLKFSLYSVLPLSRPLFLKWSPPLSFWRLRYVTPLVVLMHVRCFPAILFWSTTTVLKHNLLRSRGHPFYALPLRRQGSISVVASRPCKTKLC